MPSPPDDEEISCDALTADFRIHQRRRGHRFSLDDLATAWEASCAQPEARRCMDLGCGIGSVLLMLAWKLPQAQLLGIEALEMSWRLAQRNVAYNGVGERVRLIHGDLRAATAELEVPAFDLISGTPPYLPVGTALASPDPQRAAARLELRGGVEDYLAAGARVLAPTGRMVVCADGRHPERVLQGAANARLQPLLRRDVFARADASTPLFSVWRLQPLRDVDVALRIERLQMRDGNGERTAQALALRQHFGLG